MEREVMAGSNEYEPISCFADNVTTQSLVGHGYQVRHLDMMMQGPFYPVCEFQGKVAFKQESGYDHGPLYIFWHKEKDQEGWYVAEKPFLHVEDERELQY